MATRTTPDELHCSSDYDRVRARHAFQLDSYLGGERYRVTSRTTLSSVSAWTYSRAEDGTVQRAPHRYDSYLVPHTAESDESFAERLRRACYLNLVAPIVDSYAEGVTNGVAREIPDSYGDMADVDRRGSSWGEHVEEVARWAALFGYVAVVYDAPPADADVASRADELARGIGPRVIIVQPIAWAWVEVDDDGCVQTFAYVERSTQDETAGIALGIATVTVRVWTLRGGDDGLTPEWQLRRGTVRGAAGIAAQRHSLGEVIDRGPLPAALDGKLPVVFAYYRRLSDTPFPLGQSVADDACDIARSIYNKLSEEDELHGKAGFPFLAIPKGAGSGLDADTRLALGPGRGLAYDSGTGAPQWVQPSAESSRELRESIVFRAAMAFRLAGIEVATDQSGQAESGIALRVRARGFEARAQRFARCMARYERQGLDLWRALVGASEEATVAYAKRYTLPDASEDLAAALDLLVRMPVEIGVEAKVAVVRKALDAVLSLPDEQMTAIVDEIRAVLESDRAEFDGARAAGTVEREAAVASHRVAGTEAAAKLAALERASAPAEPPGT